LQEDFIDIVTVDGNPIGKSYPKSQVHLKGYYHNTAHIWFYTNGGKILLQQRAASKAICPLLWDVSVAGHVDAGETIEQAAIRETKEEIGLTIFENDLQKIGVFKCSQSYKSGIKDNEFHHTYISELKIDISDLNPLEGEVEALKLVTLKEFKNKLQNKTANHFVPSNKSYYEVVLEVIQKKLEFYNLH